MPADCSSSPGINMLLYVWTFDCMSLSTSPIVHRLQKYHHKHTVYQASPLRTEIDQHHGRQIHGVPDLWYILYSLRYMQLRATYCMWHRFNYVPYLDIF